MMEKRSAYRFFVTKSEGKRPLGEEDNIDMGLKEIGWGVNCVGLLQDGDK
jgi:hypothetical protein